jgi:hypothetical protein
MLVRDFWDLFNMGQFDPIDQMLPSAVVPLRGNLCISFKLTLVHFL